MTAGIKIRRENSAGKCRTKKRGSRSWQHVFAGFGLAMLMQDGPAGAADLPVKAPVFAAIYNWTGFYVGGHVGYGGGSLGALTNPLPEQGVFFPHSVTGFIGGYQLGYNRQLSNRLVLGIEADATFTSPVDAPALRGCPRASP